VRDLGLPRNVEQVDTHKDDEEATQEGNRVDSSSGVEALEENGRGRDGSCREEDIVDRVHAVLCQAGSGRIGIHGQGTRSAHTFVENVSRALLKKF
jgi:hypothetical protein